MTELTISYKDIEKSFDEMQAAVKYYYRESMNMDNDYSSREYNRHKKLELQREMQVIRQYLEDNFDISLVYSSPGCREVWKVLTPELKDFIDDYNYEMLQDSCY